MSSSPKSTKNVYKKRGFAPRISMSGIKYCDNCNYVNLATAKKCLLCGNEFPADDIPVEEDIAASFSFGEQGSSKTFKVTLNNAGAKKLEVIKAIRNIKKCDLKRAKNIANNCPRAVIEGVTREEAVKAAGTLRSLGASVTIE